MDKPLSYERLLSLYIPWGVALFFKNDPTLSYLIAWFGSIFIFVAVLSGWVKGLPNDRSFGNQLMRPVILVHIIFAGYMCLTSIFYFLNTVGYENFLPVSTGHYDNEIKLFATAQCQRYYCLGHAAFVSGMLMFMKYPEKKRFIFNEQGLTNFLFYAAVITFPLSILFENISGLSQFSGQFNSLSFIAGTLALAFAIPEKKIWNTLISVLLYFSNFYNALTSGYKEPIIISVMVLGIFLYPNYKKVVLATFLPLLFLLFILLPTYVGVFRNNAWSGETSDDAATQLAIDAALSASSYNDIEDTNWNFLVFRLSEIDMFTDFVASTPDKVGFYRFDILKQSAWSIIPRLFWPAKPSTEGLIMERVYDAGVINRGANVSAKPAYVVDAYLSDGIFGVFLALFIYGALAQYISQKAEELFGGYILGTALIFSGLFQVFWRGLSFEFLANSVFWSYVTMLIIHKVLLARNFIQPA
jgi:hypothetical protein